MPEQRCAWSLTQNACWKKIMTFNFEKSKSYLVCPKCHSDLVPDGESLVCTNPDVRLRYPILEDIPRLLVDEAEELTPAAWAAAMQRAGR